MANLIDYLRWRGDLPLALSPFNAVDGLILCQLAYIQFAGIVPPPGGRAPVALHQAVRTLSGPDVPKETKVYRRTLPAQDQELLLALLDAPRFGTMELTGFVDDVNPDAQKQFAALTILLPGGGAYIAYRGTDDTIVGWKEDFNLTFSPVIPAQMEGARYLQRMAALVPGPLMLGGHSKGGNLAVFAAANADAPVQDRLLSVTNYDGPGMRPASIAQPGFMRIQPKVQTFLPQSSVVGMLLEHQEDYTVVQSDGAGLIMQHSPYTWQVERAAFRTLEDVTPASHLLDHTLNQWCFSLSPSQVQDFIDTLYQVVSATHARTLQDLSETRYRSAMAILAALKNIDPETRRQMMEVLRALWAVGKRSLADAAKARKESHTP